MFSIIIPCFNEGENLPSLFTRVQLLLKKYPKAEVVLVNNGSTDDSLTQMNLFKLEKPHLGITICNVKENQGYGYGILEGLKIAKHDVLGWTHADLQTDLMDAGKAYEIYMANQSKGNLMIKGYRTQRKIAETILSFGMAIIASTKLKKWLVEINAQPKLFNRSFYELIAAKAPKDFSLDLYFMVHAKEMAKIITFPVRFIPRIAGEAKGGSGSSFKTKYKIIKRTFKYMDSLKNSL